MANDIITTLHPETDENTNLYPNIKGANIPNGVIGREKLDGEVNDLLDIPNKYITRNKLDDSINALLNSINELHPSGVDTSTNILAFTYDKGIYIGSDTGYWYYWNGSQYVAGGVFQASEVVDESVTPRKTSFINWKWNLLNVGELTEQEFIRWDNTLVSPAWDFYVVEFPVKPNTQYFLKNNGKTRFITYYGASHNWVSGLGVEDYISDGIITTPSNAYYIAMSIRYVVPSEEMIHQDGYFTECTELYRCFKLKKEIKITDDNFIGKNVLKTCETRLPVITFIFDDGNVNDKQIVDAFNANNCKCGFALLSTITQDSRVSEYLEYQDNGFSILSHSTDGDPMSAPDIPNIMYKLITSKNTLENAGFNVKGFVTPSSQMNDAYIYMTEKVYDFSYTQYWNEDIETDPARQLLNTDMNRLHRRYLGTSLQNLKDEVDACINDGGCLTFYYHSANLGDDLSLVTLNELLNYIKIQEEDYKCKLLAPNDAIPYFFRVRHKDYLELLNR